MDFGIFMLFVVIIIMVISGIVQAVHEIRTGEDTRTPEQKLMDTTISDNFTRFGSAVEAVNAQARGRKPFTRF